MNIDMKDHFIDFKFVISGYLDNYLELQSKVWDFLENLTHSGMFAVFFNS